ncbi:type II toxin-antitoxin system HicB family antitoxin [Anoxynatronum sibiricum]|uniref:type II toxin-antitoxin system HicB family antitoxin n=1 Tax=Anoxynatronum sibiricum TaxID=210623 RepID=UPI0031B85793
MKQHIIECVDIQGAYTEIQENDISQGILMAEEVLGMTLADLIESGEDIPIPTPIEKLKAENGFATMVTVNIEEYIRDMKLVKKTVAVPKWANDLGQRLDINFSKVLTDAISEMVISKR